MLVRLDALLHGCDLGVDPPKESEDPQDDRTSQTHRKIHKLLHLLLSSFQAVDATLEVLHLDRVLSVIRFRQDLRLDQLGHDRPELADVEGVGLDDLVTSPDREEDR
jgi:hypothetical protein